MMILLGRHFLLNEIILLYKRFFDSNWKSVWANDADEKTSDLFVNWPSGLLIIEIVDNVDEP